MDNKKIDDFIDEELKTIDRFKTITINADEISLENYNKALSICQKSINKSMKKDGKLLDILKKINNNKLSKNDANKHIKDLVKSIRNDLDDNLNKKIKFIINNRINQLLKIAIYYILK